MATMNQSEIVAEREQQTAVWEFRKKFYHGEDDDAFWENILTETDAISRRFNSLYVDMLLIACVDDIESRFYQSKGREIEAVEMLENTGRVRMSLAERYKKE